MSTIVVHTLGRFVKAYFLELGCLEGTLGLAISGLQACEVFQKYLRLWELGRFAEELPWLECAVAADVHLKE